MSNESIDILKRNGSEAPDLGAVSPGIAGDWGDDDPAVMGAYFEEDMQGPTPADLPQTSGEPVVTLPRAPRRLFTRRYALTIEQGPIQILPPDPDRLSVQLMNETAGTVHAYVAGNRDALSVITGTGVVLPNAALLHSPNQYVEFPGYDGALWVCVDPSAAAATAIVLHVIAIAE